MDKACFSRRLFLWNTISLNALNEVNKNPSIIRNKNIDGTQAPEVITTIFDNGFSPSQEFSSDHSDYVHTSTDSLEDNLSPDDFLESGNEREEERTDSYSL